ncbi:MAG: hypothetical protein ACXVIU_07250 [Halobacteriota archaeon]
MGELLLRRESYTCPALHIHFINVLRQGVFVMFPSIATHSMGEDISPA